MRAPQSGSESRWQGRPVGSALLRVALHAVPVVASMAAGIGTGHLAASSLGARTPLWWLAVAAASLVVLLAVDRLARRLLPLAALLRLSMAFPDAAPSRFKIARLTRSTAELERRVAEVHDSGAPTSAGQAAATILALVAALSEHDRRTRGHSERVRVYTDLVAEPLTLPVAARDRLRWAALVHDIGKVEVPRAILNKRGRPSDREWEVLRSHPADGARLCEPLMAWLGEWGRAVVEHHERYDGGGYPAGLGGDQLSLAGRILAVADSYEVMTAARPYKRAMTAAAAREELTRCAGSQFDPLVVRAFLSIPLTRLRLAMGPLSWLAQLPFLWRVPSLAASAGAVTTATVGATAIGFGALSPSLLPRAPAGPAAVIDTASDLGVGAVDQADRSDTSTAPGSGERSTTEPDRTSPTTPASDAPEVGGGTPAGRPTRDAPSDGSSSEPGSGESDSGGGSEGSGGDSPPPGDDVGDPVGDIVSDVGDAVTDTGDTVGDVVDDVDDTGGGIVDEADGAVGEVVEGADGALGGLGGG